MNSIAFERKGKKKYKRQDENQPAGTRCIVIHGPTASRLQ
jgi:hypothetical protein